MKTFVCSICGKKTTGHGNNAEPVNSGRCCDECNTTIVITERLKRQVSVDIKGEKMTFPSRDEAKEFLIQKIVSANDEEVGVYESAFFKLVQHDKGVGL